MLKGLVLVPRRPRKKWGVLIGFFFTVSNVGTLYTFLVSGPVVKHQTPHVGSKRSPKKHVSVFGSLQSQGEKKFINEMKNENAMEF